MDSAYKNQQLNKIKNVIGDNSEIPENEPKTIIEILSELNENIKALNTKIDNITYENTIRVDITKIMDGFALFGANGDYKYLYVGNAENTAP